MPNDDDAILAHPTGYPQNLTIAERKRIWLLIHAGQQMRPSGSLDDFTRELAVDNLLEQHWTAHKGELERLLALQQIDERGVTVLRRDAPAEALESITGIRRGRSGRRRTCSHTKHPAECRRERRQAGVHTPCVTCGSKRHWCDQGRQRTSRSRF
jgi:hypothetical protein